MNTITLEFKPVKVKISTENLTLEALEQMVFDIRQELGKTALAGALRQYDEVLRENRPRGGNSSKERGQRPFPLTNQPYSYNPFRIPLFVARHRLRSGETSPEAGISFPDEKVLPDVLLNTLPINKLQDKYSDLAFFCLQDIIAISYS